MSQNQGTGRRRGKRRGRGKRNNNQVKEGAIYEQLNRDRISTRLLAASPFPMSQTRKITFQENLLIQSANPYLVKDYRANSAYDPDAALGGGTLVGFAQMSAIYQQYHVTRVDWEYTVASNEPSVPINFGFILRDKQPSTTYVSWAECQYALRESPTTGMDTVGETSGMGVFRSKRFSQSLGNVIGKKLTYMSDVDYTAAVTTNPSQIVWLSLVVLGATSATALTNGLIINLKITFHTRFWSLVNFEPTMSGGAPIVDSSVVGNFLEAVYVDADGKYSRVLRDIPQLGGRRCSSSSSTLVTVPE